MSKQVPEIQPVFVDFKKELTEIELAIDNKLPLIYKKE
jgi:hypothetical protein